MRVLYHWLDILGVREERVKSIFDILVKEFDGIDHGIIKDSGTVRNFLGGLVSLSAMLIGFNLSVRKVVMSWILLYMRLLLPADPPWEGQLIQWGQSRLKPPASPSEISLSQISDGHTLWAASPDHHSSPYISIKCPPSLPRPPSLSPPH